VVDGLDTEESLSDPRVPKNPSSKFQLPVTDTLEEAMSKARLLNELAFGVVPQRSGFAIRVKPGDRVAALKTLTPDYAEAVGDELLKPSKKEKAIGLS